MLNLSLKPNVAMRKITILSITLLLSTVLPLVSQEKVKQGISLDRLQRYEKYIQAEIDGSNINGAVSLIVSNGEVIQHKAFGYSDKDRKRAMEVDDLFYIQSMTKPIITTAFMMLYEEGHFLLWDPVSKYIPEFENIMVDRKSVV